MPIFVDSPKNGIEPNICVVIWFFSGFYFGLLAPRVSWHFSFSLFVCLFVILTISHCLSHILFDAFTLWTRVLRTFLAPSICFSDFVLSIFFFYFYFFIFLSSILLGSELFFNTMMPMFRCENALYFCGKKHVVDFHSNVRCRQIFPKNRKSNETNKQAIIFKANGFSVAFSIQDLFCSPLLRN